MTRDPYSGMPRHGSSPQYPRIVHDDEEAIDVDDMRPIPASDDILNETEDPPFQSLASPNIPLIWWSIRNILVLVALLLVGLAAWVMWG